MNDPAKVWTVADHLAGQADEHVALYEAVAAILQSFGPTTISVAKTTITFKGSRRGFAGARPTRHGVEGYLDLMRSLEGDPRIRSVAPYTKRLFVNSFRVASVDDLDEAFIGWAREAFDVGQGGHLDSAPVR